MKIALLPLDERPANIRYPEQIAAIAGIELVLPPADCLPDLRTPANRSRLGVWLDAVAAEVAGVVASVDLLAHGGLIASRLSDEALAEPLRCLEPLWRVQAPERPLFAFNVIQRTSNANDATEEAPYWGEYGVALYRYSKVLDSALNAMDGPIDGEAAIPSDVRHAWLARRLRNHTLNLSLLHAASQGRMQLLVIPSDDTAPLGMGARERKHLEAYAAALRRASNPAAGDVLLYPGADDLGSSLVARMINTLSGFRPRVFVSYLDESMRHNIAPFEDRACDATVGAQIAAVGGLLTDDIDQADVVLAVSPPFERTGDADPHWRDHDSAQRRACLLPGIQEIAGWIDAGRTVAIADLAFANGAEPVLVELLLQHCDMPKLAAFGGWNTAGNTLGTVLGSACVPCRNADARRLALSHRLLEDWGYQSGARETLWRWVTSTLGTSAGMPARLGEATAVTEAAMAPFAERIRAAGLPCTPRNIRHPWRRPFEVDFDLHG